MTEEEGNKIPQTKRKVDAFQDVAPAVRNKTKKMMMYLIIFAGFTSGYIVMNAGTYWVHITPPAILYWSIGALAASSLFIVLAIRAIKQANKAAAQLLVILTLIGGIVFTTTQWMGWNELSEKGMGFSQSLDDNGLEKTTWNRIDQIKGEYGVDFYVYRDEQVLRFEDGKYFITARDGKELDVSGEVELKSNSSAGMIAVLLVVHILHLALGLVYLIINLIRIRKLRINSGDHVQLQVNGTYWHFMGLLWVYLFYFLFFIH
jgi:heme/copper-type cytochrome/quinol oxidase subunit 3